MVSAARIPEQRHRRALLAGQISGAERAQQTDEPAHERSSIGRPWTGQCADFVVGCSLCTQQVQSVRKWGRRSQAIRLESSITLRLALASPSGTPA